MALLCVHWCYSSSSVIQPSPAFPKIMPYSTRAECNHVTYLPSISGLDVTSPKTELASSLKVSTALLSPAQSQQCAHSGFQSHHVCTGQHLGILQALEELASQVHFAYMDSSDFQNLLWDIIIPTLYLRKLGPREGKWLPRLPKASTRHNYTLKPHCLTTAKLP